MMHIRLPKGELTTVDDSDFKWLNQHKWRRIGNKKYVARCEKIGGKTVWFFMHREIMKTAEGQVCLFKDNDVLNNTRDNLENCTKSEERYRTQPRKKKYTGVVHYRRLGKYMARISVNKQVLYLGYFDTDEAAAKAYNEAAILYYGKNAVLNVIGGGSNRG